MSDPQPESSVPATSEDAFEITVRDVPALVAAFEYAEKHVPELPGWLPGAMERTYKAAEANGGVARTHDLPYLNRNEFAPEPVFIVIYDGDPNAGPMQVDVTTPVLGRSPEDAAKNDALMVIPAHKEAFVRLKRSQADPQDLGKAYVAVEQWLLAQGHSVGGPPREVYYTDYFGASPHDEVCDIAWPIS